MSVPCFAVVGQPNKGKSSIVATLAEDERIGISPTPGTTRQASRYTLTVAGEPIYTLVDTPGFQRARAVLTWLNERANDASQRGELVRQFVEAHAEDERFHDEVELLRPILDGAGILYVVDGAKPYGPEYEIEMQILQWTGQPRMALINRIGDSDFRQDWRRALDQYFSIVREFDAVGADFETRLSVLGAFAELKESWRPSLMRATEVLRAERRRRRSQSARHIADLIARSMTMQKRERLEAEQDSDALRARLTDGLMDDVRRRERLMQRQVQALYRHEHAALESGDLDLVSLDLFSEEGWELFGLSREKLVIAGALGGAAAGGGLDLLVGGASLLLGTLVGGVIGGVSALLGGRELARVEVLGSPIGGDMLVVGPVQAANFPWVLLGRAVTHFRLVSERNHARREALNVALRNDAHIMDQIGDSDRRALAARFSDIRKGDGDMGAVGALAEEIERLLAEEETHA